MHIIYIYYISYIYTTYAIGTQPEQMPRFETRSVDVTVYYCTPQNLLS